MDILELKEALERESVFFAIERIDVVVDSKHETALIVCFFDPQLQSLYNFCERLSINGFDTRQHMRINTFREIQYKVFKKQ